MTARTLGLLALTLVGFAHTADAQVYYTQPQPTQVMPAAGTSVMPGRFVQGGFTQPMTVQPGYVLPAGFSSQPGVAQSPFVQPGTMSMTAPTGQTMTYPNTTYSVPLATGMGYPTTMPGTVYPAGLDGTTTGYYPSTGSYPGTVMAQPAGTVQRVVTTPTRTARRLFRR